jgi:hypothetical protein
MFAPFVDVKKLLDLEYKIPFRTPSGDDPWLVDSVCENHPHRILDHPAVKHPDPRRTNLYENNTTFRELCGDPGAAEKHCCLTSIVIEIVYDIVDFQSFIAGDGIAFGTAWTEEYDTGATHPEGSVSGLPDGEGRSKKKEKKERGRSRGPEQQW